MMDPFWFVLLLATTAPYWLPCMLILGALALWVLARAAAVMCEGIALVVASKAGAQGPVKS